MFFKKGYIIIIILLLYGWKEVKADRFLPQKDSYFGYRRARIYWKMAFGVDMGISYKTGSEITSVNRNVEMRTIGGITPDNSLIKYFYNSININYNLYNNEVLDNKNEVIIFNVIYGVGFKINRKLSLYTGAGGGMVFNIDRFNVSAENEKDIIVNFNRGRNYIGNIGLEYEITRLLSFFIDSKISYNEWVDDSKYIPANIENYEEINNSNFSYRIIDKGDSFKIVKDNTVQFNFSFGIRFYWGENMFWWLGFWEKN